MTLDLNAVTALDLNLDSEDAETLWAFWKRANGVRPISFAKQLFPNREKGYVRATKDLRNYAANKATAVGLRLEGKIESARTYEDICDRIYRDLPEWARGW